MTTIQDLFGKVRALLNRYTEDGVQINESEYADLQAKAIPLFDMAHKELYERAKTDAEQEEPTDITTIDDETEVNYKADQAMVYYVASRLATKGNQSLVQFFEDKFEQLKRECGNKATFEDITDEYPTGYTTTETEV